MSGEVDLKVCKFLETGFVSAPHLKAQKERLLTMARHLLVIPVTTSQPDTKP